MWQKDITHLNIFLFHSRVFDIIVFISCFSSKSKMLFSQITWYKNFNFFYITFFFIVVCHNSGCFDFCLFSHLSSAPVRTFTHNIALVYLCCEIHQFALCTLSNNSRFCAELSKRTCGEQLPPHHGLLCSGLTCNLLNFVEGEFIQKLHMTLNHGD